MNQKLVLLALLTSLWFGQAMAQDVQNSRRSSQRASTTQRIGTTDITIVYHRPLAKGRKVFGGIVPFDFVVDAKEYAWRAGANDRTTIEFTHDVTIEGQQLPSGKYGFVVLVSEKEWTMVFSKDLSWGAFQYDPKDDALRVAVKTEAAPYQGWLSYSFINLEAEAVGVELRWEETKASFIVGTDVSAKIISDLAKKEDKTTSDYRDLAVETLKKDPSQVDEALALVEKSFAGLDDVEDKYRPREEFNSKILKADLLMSKGNKKEGNALKKEALESAKGFNLYYYGLNTLLVKGDQKEAFRLLTENVQKNPNQWQGHLALGEYYLKDGDQQKVVEHFKKSYEFAPENWKNYARYLYLQNKLVLDR